jgi:acetyltransferase-like isoleucine patch superfamily enzyme
MDSAGFFHQINVDAAEDCVISPFCTLENVVLGPGAVVRDGVQLKNVVADAGVRFSRNVTFYSPVPDRPVRIGRNCWLSFGAFGEGTGAEIVLSDYVVVAHNTTILTSSGPGSCSPVMDAIYPTQAAPVRLGRHCWIGAHCVLLPGACLAEGVVLGANSLAVAGEHRAWSVYGGSPARLLKSIDPAKVEAARRKCLLEGDLP